MSNPKPKFKKPFFISPHAVERFQQRVANIPAADVITIVQASLQVPKQPLYTFKRRDGTRCPVYLHKYAGIPYATPVTRGKGEWPVVPTVLGPRELKKREEFLRR